MNYLNHNDECVCARCGNNELVEYREEDELGHAEEWVECRTCGSDDIISINEEL